MDASRQTFYNIYDFCRNSDELIIPSTLLIKNEEGELKITPYSSAIVFDGDDYLDERIVRSFLENLQKEYAVNIDTFCYYYYDEYSNENNASQLLQIINGIRGRNDLETYSTVEFFEHKLLDVIDERMIKESEETQRVIDNIDKISEANQEVEYLYNTLETITEREISQYFTSDITLNGKSLIPKKGLEFFKSLRSSRKVLYIHYTDNTGKNMFQLYTGDEDGERIPYDKIVPKRKREEKRNTIQLVFWIEKGDIKKAKPSSFFKASINLETSQFVVKIPNIEAKRHILEITNTLKEFSSDIKFSRLSEVYATVEYIIDTPDNFVYEEGVFLDLLLTNPFFSYSMYVDERVSPACKRKFVKFTNVPFLSRFFREKNGNYPGSRTSFKISEIKRKKSDGEITKKLRILISKANKENRLECYNDVLKCISVYLKGRDMYYEDQFSTSSILNDIRTTFEFYQLSIPNLYQEQLNWESMNKEETYVKKNAITYDADGRHKTLRIKHPEIFSRGYKNICQGSKAPSSYVTESTARRVANSISRNVKPMPFPPDKQKIWIVCEDKEYKYPTIIKNLDPETIENYPYLPCCTNDQYRGALYREIYLGEEDVTEKTQVRKLTADKFLKIGAIGTLEKTFLTFMESLFENKTFFTTLGLSDTPSTNSLLHCYYFATDIKFRNNAVLVGKNSLIKKSFEEREREIVKRRMLLADKELAILRQENYDISEEDLKQRILNNKVFLDPARYYRLLEDEYDIYVFENSTRMEGDRIVNLEVPRCKIFHAREWRNRKCIIILKNHGPNALMNVGISPQCELLYYEDVNNKKNYIFPESVSRACFEALQNIQDVSTWIGDNLVQYDKLPFLHTFEMNFGPLMISQVIDSTGHCRIINIESSFAYSLFVPPCQPFSIPSTKIVYRNATSEKVINLMKNLGDPTGCSVEGGYVTGLWFEYLGLEEGIHVPIRRERNKRYKVLSNPPIVESTLTSEVKRTSTVKMYAQIFKLLVEWLFYIYRIQYSGTSQEFIKEYCYIKEKGKNSLDEYNFETLSDLLPEVSTLTDALDYIESNTKGMCVNGRIRCYNKTLYSRVVYIVEQYEWKTKGKEYAFNENIVPLSGKGKEFSHNSVTLYSKEELQIFISRQDNSSSYDINTIGSVDYSSLTSPYIFRTYEGYFLVQNIHTKENEIKRGVALFDTWMDERVNLGNEIVPTDKVIPTVIYVIKKSGAIQRYGQFSKYGQVVKGKEYVRILRYGNVTELKSGRYLSAALLPL